jgi:hypothetical protein
MKSILAVPALVSVAWLCGACAQTTAVAQYSGQSSEMGAGSAPPGMLCQDGVLVNSSSACDMHGGVADQPGRDDPKVLTDRSRP